MAKKADKSEKASKGGKVVTIADLAEKYEMEGRKIRIIAREIGLKAPEVAAQKDGEFGPKSKYEWKEGDADLKKLEAAIKEAQSKKADDNKPAKGKKKKAEEEEEKPTKSKKASKKKAEPEPEEDEDESDDDDSDDEDDEDEDEE